MRYFRRIYHPELFQGSLNKKNYFEGWYFKHVSKDNRDAFAVIPGISLSDDGHSFIQYIDGNSGRTTYFRYKTGDLKFSKKVFEIRIGRSYFSENEIILNLENNDHRIEGRIYYSNINHLPKSLLRPGIMGWYSFVPGMECNHGVVSTGHSLRGSIIFNGENTDYTGGKGYIEKDWGISFPENWIWLQCNSFGHDDASVMISVAKIPWRGSWFMGFISFLRINSKTQVFATYNRARIRSIRRIDDTRTEIIIIRGSYTLTATVTKRGSGTLKAPSMGLMNNVIKESLNSEVAIVLKSGDDIVFSGAGIRAGYEETEGIFSYFL